MQQKKLVKVLIGTGLIMSFGIFGRHIVSMSTTMGTETELAGMSYTLDQYCSVQAGVGQSDPEAIIAFEDAPNGGGEGTSVSGTSVEGATPAPEVEEVQATPKPESEYANVGISIAADYVNIRKKPTTESEIIGKLYRGSAATITRTEGDWVYIKSGSVSGYIMKDYLAIGYSAEKLIDDFGTKWATVTTETLKVREEPNTECTVLTLIPEDESYEVLKEETDWVKIRVDGDTTGYVSSDYVKLSVQFEKAVSIEEEREEARRKAAAEAAEREEQRKISASSSSSDDSSSSSKSSSSNSSSSSKSSSSSSSSSKSSSSSSSSNKSSSSNGGSGSSKSSGGSSNGGGGKSGSAGSSSGSGGSSGSSDSGSSSGSGGSSGSSNSGSSNGGGGSALGSGDGSAIASYALKFVGNPYVYGGTSLTNGTDCSGFTMSVFAKFGISLPRVSRDQAKVGKKIDPSDAEAGDLIFYASGGRVNHVALCIGGGRVVHASNPRVGIITSNMYYRTPYCARRVLN